MPGQHLALVALVVDEYEPAIEFFCGKLGFELIEDRPLPDEAKRWVVVAPKGSPGAQILLSRARDSDQQKAIGKQTMGRVGFFLYTNNFWQDYESFRQQGIQFVRPPKEENYGTVAVFQDLYGNLWDLLEPSDESATVSELV